MRAFFVGAVLGALLEVAVPAQSASALFDGESLQGWRGDPAVWRVEDGAIVGSSHGVKLAHNTFLWHEGEFGDFELRLKVRLEGDNNSGVHYRSQVVDDAAFRVGGYQCDLHPKPAYMAMLYHELGAGIVATHGQFVRWTDGDREVLGELAKPRPVDLLQWHDLRIVARGDLCWHELDGRVVTAVQDLREAAPRRGVIALQVHQGSPMTVSFRDLTLRAWDTPHADGYPAVPAAVRGLLRRAQLRVAVPPGATPMWIWDQQTQNEQEVFFRRAFALAAVPAKARLSISCDNHCRVYVNGERVAQDDSWESPTVVDIAASLQPGDNVVAVHGWNDGGPAAMALRLAWQLDDADHELVSDASWLCSDDDPDGWASPGFDAAGWAKVKVLARVGDPSAVWSGQLAADALGTQVDEMAPQVAILETEIDCVPSGPSQPLRLLDVPRSLGSWVSLAADPSGRLYTSSQGGGLYRVVPAVAAGELTTIERVPVELGGAHGLLWWRDALYAVVNGKQDGLYRLTDTDGDDMLDRVELLRALDGSGEHGPHSVCVAPDGENLLVLCGNMTKLTELAASRVQTNWAEDRLMPRIEDARGFWGGYSPPGGCLYQVDPDGQRWELICCGFRNPFDMVVLPNGQVVVYDADMEWDLGLPWYRPTRYLAAQSGVDYGWRKGSAKWPVDYPETPEALQDIGPGSPTGMVYVPGSDGGVVSLDWTFGTVHFEGQPWFVGAPFPVADVTLATGDPSSAGVYVVTGGRGLPSRLVRLRTYSAGAADSEAEQRRLVHWGALRPWRESETRSAAEILAAAATGADQEPSRFVPRQPGDWVTARIALERLPVEQYRDTVLAVDALQPERSLTGLLALARQGVESDRQAILAALGKFVFADLGHKNRIAWLRVHALALLRLGPVADAHRKSVADRLLPLLPTGNERQDQDLCELLAYVGAPGLLPKAVPLLTPLEPSEPPAWADVITRNATYGSVIEKMMANMPPMGQLAIANALRTVADGWTIEQRRTLFSFLAEARTRSGGASYDGYVIAMAEAAWLTCSEAEQQQLELVYGKARAAKEKRKSTPPVGPGHDWQLSDIDALVAGDLDDRDLDSGRNLFRAVGCASCHYFNGEGGFGGPDLTSLGSKFRAQDVLEAVLEPSIVISDQYSGQVLTRKDGTALFGVVHKTYFGDEEVYEVIPAVADAEPVRIPVGEVARVEPSPLSPMPGDLIDRLSADEVRDLVAFLLSGGKSKNDK